MKKSITIICGKKMPIEGIAFSSVEASAHFTAEWTDEDGMTDDKVLEYCRENLNKALVESAKVIGEADIISILQAKANKGKEKQKPIYDLEKFNENKGKIEDAFRMGKSDELVITKIEQKYDVDAKTKEAISEFYMSIIDSKESIDNQGFSS